MTADALAPPPGAPPPGAPPPGAPPPGEPVFRAALYGADGILVKTAEVFPFEDPPNPQTVADLCARAADTGCTYEAGTFLIWTDPDTQPHKQIEQTPQADGSCSFGPPHPPVPTHRWTARVR